MELEMGILGKKKKKVKIDNEEPLSESFNSSKSDITSEQKLVYAEKKEAERKSKQKSIVNSMRKQVTFRNSTKLMPLGIKIAAIGSDIAGD